MRRERVGLDDRWTGARGADVDILMNCSRCEGQVAFRPARRSHRGAGEMLVGRCGGCEGTFGLQRGRLVVLDLGGSPAPPRPLLGRLHRTPAAAPGRSPRAPA
jgi:hypothetical protein